MAQWICHGELAIFFQAAQSFLYPLAVGPNNFLQGNTPSFLSGADSGAYVMCRIPRLKEQSGRKQFHGRGQIMAKLFELTAQKSVIQDKAAVILHHA